MENKDWFASIHTCPEGSKESNTINIYHFTAYTKLKREVHSNEAVRKIDKLQSHRNHNISRDNLNLRKTRSSETRATNSQKKIVLNNDFKQLVLDKSDSDS